MLYIWKRTGELAKKKAKRNMCSRFMGMTKATVIISNVISLIPLPPSFKTKIHKVRKQKRTGIFLDHVTRGTVPKDQTKRQERKRRRVTAPFSDIIISLCLS